jgi:hypothetical protein
LKSQRVFYYGEDVMKDPRNFVDWVCDPARTNDELFTVELLIEQRRSNPDWPFPELREDFDARMERMRARGRDPGYRPGLHEGEIEQLSLCATKPFGFHGGNGPDLPLRDLKALAFFPALTSLSLSTDTSDLTPLASLPRLESLSIGEYNDLAGSMPIRMSDCGEMRELIRIHLALRQPWPDLRALSGWPALKEVRFGGNILAFEEVPALPVAQLVQLKGWVRNETPLRDLRRLPVMPAVRQLLVEGTISLEGIERYPSAVNLEVGGTFRDLMPLAAMTNITALTLTGEFFQDLSPLSLLPKLREVRFVRERAIDLSPLADCPQLRRVEMERCAMMRTEVAALNAGLLPEAPDFEAEKPRELAPLKFFTMSKENVAGGKFIHARYLEYIEVRERFYDGDAAFAAAETRVAQAAIQERLDHLLGRGWGLLNWRSFVGGYGMFGLKRFADTSRVREVIQVLREHSARSRFPWHFLLSAEPHGDMSEDMEERKAREEKAAAAEGDWLAEYYTPESVLRENEERRRERERYYEFLEREHLLQLREEGGVDPSLLYLPKEEPEKAAEVEEEPIPPQIADDEDAGGVAIAPPPPPPPGTKDLGEELAFHLDVYEDCIVAGSHWVDAARYGLGQMPVEWTPDL